MKRLTFLAGFVLLFACGTPDPGAVGERSSASRTSTWSFTALDPPGSVFTFPTGLNDRGTVAFQFADAGWTFHGAVLDAGAYTVVDVPGSEETLAGAPGPDGEVPLAWATWSGDARYHQALYARGEITPLPDAPGWQHVSPSGLTGRNQVCGVVFSDALPSLVGFVWNGSRFTFVEHPASDVAYTAVLGCNARGQVAGYYRTSDDGLHAFVKTGDAYEDLAYPGAEATVALSIAADGAVAGSYGAVGPGPFGIAVGGHGFVLEHGRFTTLDYPGAVLSFPTGINARGDVVGAFFDEEGNLHGYLAERR